MKRYISIIIGILTSLSLSAATFPTEGFGSDVGYGEFGVEDYGSDEVGADIPIDSEYDGEVVTIVVTKSNGETMTLEDVMVYSDQAYNDGDVITGPYFGSYTLSAVVHETIDGVDVTYSYPGYLFPVTPAGKLAYLGGGAVVFKMPLDDNLAVALMLILMAAGYGAVRMRRKRVEVA